MKKQIKVDTTSGYSSKPKPRRGDRLERYYCECACKQGYWRYKEEAPAKIDEEDTLKLNYFRAQKQLRKFLSDKYWKYNGKPIQLKKNAFPKWKGTRIGFYDSFDMPTFMNHGRLHWGLFGKKKYHLCEDEFEIYKKPIKNKTGETIHFVDVKCPACSHITLVDMQYLVWKYNCKKCKETLTINDRVKKSKINLNEYR